MAVGVFKDPELYVRLRANNLRRQFDVIRDCVEICLDQGVEAFDKYMLWGLNAAALTNIDQFGGRYRQNPVFVPGYMPPRWEDVPDLMDQLISEIHQKWKRPGGRCDLAALATWRISWIHPFRNANGRTARAAAYILICLRAGALLPGDKIIPSRMAENQDAYLAALQKVDQNWANGMMDASPMAAFLDRLLDDQLANR